MMIVKPIMIMALTAVSVTAAAQQQYSVKCQLSDSTGAGEPYATARIYLLPDTSKVVTTGVTEADGSFSASLKAPGTYRLRFSSVGKADAVAQFTLTAKQPEASLGKVVIRDNGNMLSTVTVTAQKPIVTAEIDRLSYDIQADDDSKTKNVLEMLRKVPLVSVDAQDNIKVRGSSSFKIYKNGHPDPSLSGTNAKEILKAIPANMIKKIEVITEPGAKYDAEGVGAILNIVMMDGSSIKGVSGSVSANINNYGEPGANGYITTQIGNVTASVNYGYNHSDNKNVPQYGTIIAKYPSLEQSTSTNWKSLTRDNVHYGNIDASWEIDTLNLMTLSFGGYYYNSNTRTSMDVARYTSNGSTLYSYNASSRNPKSPSYYDFNGRFDFQHKTHHKDEALTLSYMLSTERSTNSCVTDYTDVLNIPVDYTSRTTDTHQRIVEHTVQLDWTRPFAQYHKVETGVKYINRLNSSHSIYSYGYPQGVTPSIADSDVPFDHRTQVAAAYASYTFSRNKWSARAGLRYEFSRLSASYPDGSKPGFGSNLSDWVPSASVQYRFNDANTLKCEFSTRINRPGIYYLDPAVDDGVESKSYGNPDLKSARTYSTSITYMHVGNKLTFNVVPSYSFSNNGITNVQRLEDGKQVTTYGNVAHTQWAGVSGYVQWTPFTKTSVMFSPSVGYSKFESRDLDVVNDGCDFNLYVQVSQTLPAGFRLQAYGGCFDNGPVNLYGTNSFYGWYGLGAQWSGTKDDRLTIGISATNFGTKYMHYENRIVQGPYTQVTGAEIEARSIRFTVSYRFGSLKASVKKTDKSIENTDVVGGSSKGGK